MLEKQIGKANLTSARQGMGKITLDLGLCEKNTLVRGSRIQNTVKGIINSHWLSVAFDWSTAGHTEGAILLCCMIILPSDVISV